MTCRYRRGMAYLQGQHVFVPNDLVGRHRAPSAVDRYEIAEVGAPGQHARSVRVILSADEDADAGWVAAARVHERIGISLVRVGDLGSETALLDPLAKSLDHFLGLVVGHDYFKVAYVRTQVEFEQFWSQHHGFTSHLILIAHGRDDAIRLIGGNADFEHWMTGDALAGVLDVHGGQPGAHVLSLCCRTGYAAFSGSLTGAAAVRTCIAPIRDVHAAVASQFAQTLLAEHLLHGRTWPIAFRRARAATLGTSAFRLWRDGAIAHGAAGG